jgi:hypothetical protein
MVSFAIAPMPFYREIESARGGLCKNSSSPAVTHLTSKPRCTEKILFFCGLAVIAELGIWLIRAFTSNPIGSDDNEYSKPNSKHKSSVRAAFVKSTGPDRTCQPREK